VIVLLSAIGNIVYSEQLSMPIRASMIIVMGLVALFIASRTAKGRLVLGFVKDARSEVRKVVWPTRQETLQTTMVVSIFVLLMSMVLWGVDVLFASLISRIVGV
jgi:preprotein translocase subunit SecE